MTFHTRFLLWLILCTPLAAQAMKPMSDEEVRDLIVQGSIKDFEEGTRCSPDFQVRKKEPRRYTEGQAAGATTDEESKVENPFVCECACPFSKDLKGNTCGNKSAYFLDSTNKPKCYREDVKDYEVNDFRSEYGVPDPNKPHPENR
jgi:hypothetical protein